MKNENLIIVGCARSGTSVVVDFFNLAKQIIVLAEAEVALNHNQNYFAEWFNKHSMAEKKSVIKGYYLPSFLEPEFSAAQVMTKLSEYYSIVGDKIALAPYRQDQKLILSALGKHYFNSTYILCLRDPKTCIYSMSKMWPDATIKELLRTWVFSFAVILTIHSLFKISYVLMHERYSSEYFIRLGIKVGCVVNIGEGAVSKNHQNVTDIAEMEMDLTDRKIFDDCVELYEMCAEAYNPDSFNFQYLNNQVRLLDHFLTKADQLMSNVGFGNIASYLEFSQAAKLMEQDSIRRVLIDLDLAKFDEMTLKQAQYLVEHYPEVAVGYYALALNLQRQSNIEFRKSALQYYDFALDKGYDSFWIYYNKSQCYLLLNDFDNAEKCIFLAKKLNPSHPDLPKVIEQISSRKMVKIQ